MLLLLLAVTAQGWGVEIGGVLNARISSQKKIRATLTFQIHKPLCTFGHLGHNKEIMTLTVTIDINKHEVVENEALCGHYC